MAARHLPVLAVAAAAAAGFLERAHADEGPTGGVPPQPVLPPSGWSTWNSFSCDINASLVRQGADHLASSGLLGAGYRYILIDDCWSLCERYDAKDGYCEEPGGRDAKGNLIPDPIKFPDGMRALAHYVHSVGALFGIYTSIGPLTCGGYTGSAGHEDADAALFAEWGVDFIKVREATAIAL